MAYRLDYVRSGLRHTTAMGGDDPAPSVALDALSAETRISWRAARRVPAGRVSLMLLVPAAAVALVALGSVLLHRPAARHAAAAPVSAPADTTAAATGGNEAPVPPNSQHLTEAQAARQVLQTLSGGSSAAAAQSSDATSGSSSQPGAGVGPLQSAVPAPGATPTAAGTAWGQGSDASDAPADAPAPGGTAGWASSQSAAAQPAPFAAAPPAALAAEPVVTWPVVGPITSYFGPSHPLGIDIGVNAGTPIRAAASGRIAFVGGDPCCSYGYYVDIDHGNGVLTRYGHMLYLPALHVGQQVHIGDIIGLVGSTGFSTGPHLHFEVRLNDMVVDPLLVLPPHP
ncbi:MAG TPA: M23 family metallopeptidase [Dehalococcoidia bacterium]|nr:M23 family metallopeptidase [Dehalococcoidia bacterium]